MAFDNTLTLVDFSEANQNFVAQSRLQGGVDYIESDATAESTRRLSIRHTNAGASVLGKGAKPIRRHLVQFTHEKWNSELGKTEKATVNVTITVDPGASITTTEKRDLIAFAISLIGETANQDRLLRDEA